MSYKRLLSAAIAAFLVSELLAIVVHGFILAADYGPFYGKLLRSEPSWQMLLLPVAHLAFVCALVWIAGRLGLSGAPAAQGLKLGALGWIVGQVPLWLVWYAEQPWPGPLVLKQLGLELASSLIIGLTIGVVARLPDRRTAVLRPASAAG
jgi:hypothetical protein